VRLKDLGIAQRAATTPEVTPGTKGPGSSTNDALGDFWLLEYEVLRMDSLVISVPSIIIYPSFPSVGTSSIVYGCIVQSCPALHRLAANPRKTPLAGGDAGPHRISIG
jgi:hypothetical protein